MKTNFGFVQAKFDGPKITYYPELYKNIKYSYGFPGCCGARLHLNTANKVGHLNYKEAAEGILILEGEHAPLEQEQKNIIHTVVQTKNGPITVRVRQ